MPRDLGREIRRPKDFAIRAVENVEHTVAIAVHQQLARLSRPHLVDEQHRLHGIPVVRVVGCELVIPLHLAGLGRERDDARRVEVVADALFTSDIRTGIADGPINQVELAFTSPASTSRRTRVRVPDRSMSPSPSRLASGSRPSRFSGTAAPFFAKRDFTDLMTSS